METKETTLNELKTVLVIYSNKELNNVEAMRAKKYAFNTLADLQIGDRLISDEYDTKMQIVKILDKGFKYFNASTGELSDTFNSTSQWEIRELIIQDAKQASTVYAILEERNTKL